MAWYNRPIRPRVRRDTVNMHHIGKIKPLNQEAHNIHHRGMNMVRSRRGDDGIRSYEWLDELLDRLPARVTVIVEMYMRGGWCYETC